MNGLLASQPERPTGRFHPQNMTLALNCSTRGELLVAVTLPKLDEVMLMFGPAKTTQFSGLKASAWNASRTPSRIWNSRRRLRLSVYRFGSCSPSTLVRGVFPYVNGAGDTNAFLSRNAGAFAADRSPLP